MEAKPASQEHCSRCGAAFQCGVLAGADHCWCQDLPHVLPVDDQAQCLCPACLEQVIAASESSGSSATGQ